MSFFETEKDKQDILDLVDAFGRNNLFELEFVLGLKCEAKMKLKMMKIDSGETVKEEIIEADNL